MKAIKQALPFGLLMLALLALPLLAAAANEPFYITLIGRMLILAIAVASLNLLISFGGMVSFGHALYIGLGAYAVGILNFYEINNGYAQLALAAALSIVVAGLSGAIVLRTTGIAFIMISLAFAQMFYFLAVSLKQFGGDDGLPLSARSDFGVFDLSSDAAVYYAAWLTLVVVLLGTQRWAHSRFGTVLRAAKANPERMAALGYPLLRYQLAAYVLAAVVCAVAGVLLANLARFTSPSYVAWSLSGELIVMVVLGTLMCKGNINATVAAPVLGTLVFLGVEEALKAGTEHWAAVLGVLIVGVVLLPVLQTKWRSPS
jgi:branched-chain amino acid transport system permease protein